MSKGPELVRRDEHAAVWCDGGNVTRAREMLGLSPRDVADRAGIAVSAVERIEAGRCVFAETVKRVATVLDLTMVEMCVLPTATSAMDSGANGTAAVPARIVLPLSWREIVRNFMSVLSCLVLADRHWTYLVARYVLRRLGIGALKWPQPSRLEGKLLAIEAFEHSGNSFLRNNIDPGLLDRVVSHTHLKWSLRRCVSHGVPTLLIVRDPMEACLSKHFRSTARHGYGFTLSLLSVLLVWLAYYRCAWRYREHLHIIMFPELVGDYASVRQRVEACSEVRMRETPIYEGRNEFVGERPSLRLCIASRLLMKLARVQYLRFARAARAQRRAISRPLLPGKVAPSPGLFGSAFRRNSLWLQPQSVLLCAFVLFEILVDWLCSHEIGFGGLGLVDIAGAMFGFVVLVKAVRRLDYVERAGPRLSAGEALEIDCDASVCTVAAILFILPGVGGDVAGAILLMPPIRYMLAAKLAAAAARWRPLIVGAVSPSCAGR